MTRKASWILMCNASRAYLYREEPARRRYILLESLEHHESRSRVRDLMSDAAGRKPNGNPGGITHGIPPGSTGGGTYLGRPGAAPESDPKEVEAQKFARELAQRLEKGRTSHEYESLILIAPPQFLGLLRATVSIQVGRHIEETIDKDLSGLDGPRREERLRELRAA